MCQNRQNIIDECKKEFEKKFLDIEVGLYQNQQNEDCVQLLISCLDGLDDSEKQIVIDQLSKIFINNPLLNEVLARYRQRDYKEEFEQSKLNKDKEKLISIFQSIDFWQLNILPQQLNDIVYILKVLDSRIFFYVIEIAECSINRIIFSQFLMLKKLLEIKYHNSLSKDYQILLEQTIGSLLINQIYELESFIQIMKQSDSSEFEKIFEIINKTNLQILQQNQLKTLFELFTPNLEKENLSQNLDSYLKKTLQIVSDNISFEQIQFDLEEFIRKDGNFDELYFKVIIYYWGQFCDFFVQKKAMIIRILDNKQIIINNFQKNQKVNSQIPLYFFDRFIYFSEFPSFPQKQDLTQFEQNQQQIQQRIIQTFKNDQPENRDLLNRDLWNEVQQLTYYSLNQIKTGNFQTEFLLKILWINMKETMTNETFISLFLDKEKCLLSYNKILSRNEFIQDLLKFDLLTLQMMKIYFEPNNSQQNSLWEPPIKYYRLYQISQLLLKRRQLFKEYPQKINIDLESFNISLAELNKEEKNKVIGKWIEKMDDQERFKDLIPFYFNIIKRGESAEQFTTLIQEGFQRLNIKSKFFNMKALFQMFYNNSNEELKMMLIKLHSKYNPVPFLYQNFYFDEITSELDLFTFNHYIYYIFPQCYPIINLSLSKKQSRYGKTNLINKVFYQEKKFEENDNCELNASTIDIMFDFSFDGCRQLAVADVHGFIQKDVLIKILSIFNLWIIQMNSENEFEENKQALINIFEETNDYSPVVCFIIRNSKTQKVQNEEEFFLIQNKKIYILRMLDLNRQYIDQQVINQQFNQAQHFLYSKIYHYSMNHEKYKVKKDIQCKKKKNFEFLCNRFIPEFIIQKINSDNHLISLLKQELHRLFNLKEGFFSIEAFPVRSIENEIKQKEKDLAKIGESEKFNREKYNILENEINLLQNELKNIEPTQMLKLFIQMLMKENYYITYLWFVETIQKFNNFHKKQFQEDSDIISQQIKEQKLQNQGQANQIMHLEQKLNETLQQTLIKSIDIENFWRELIKQTQYNKNQINQLNVVKIVYELIKKGEPCEFLDGDDLQINKDFIQALALEFNSNNERILILSALGPQSSGKSTVLNRIFGCHFLTSVGRTTKGINLQLLKIRNKEQFYHAFDFILLLDTEGLQSTNQQDQKFDQKISMFVLAVSNIIFLIVKGDIHKVVTNLIEMCIYTLSQIKESFSSYKQLIWCFNQNNDVNNTQPFKQQLQGIVTNIRNAHKEENIDFTNIIGNENIQVLGFAQVDQLLCNQWNQYKNNDTFSQVALQKCVDILKKFSNRLKYEKESLYGIKTFVKEIHNIWGSIQKMPDLVEFNELIEKQQNKIVCNQLEIIWKDEKQKLEDEISVQCDLKQQIDDWAQKQQKQITYQEFYQQSTIAARIKNTQETIQEKLQNIKEKDGICKKVYEKYKAQLERLIIQEVMEYQFLILEEIEKQKIANNEQLAKEEINNYIENLQNSDNVDQKFEELCKKQNQKYEPLYNDFEQNLIQMFKIEKNDCVLESKTKDLDFFKMKINKYEPNDNEKLEIYNNLQKQQVEELNGFMAIPKSNKYFQYIEIFKKDLLEKIISENQQKSLLKLNDCFEICKQYILIDKNDIQSYINQYLLEDLITLISNQQIRQQEMTTYFSILNCFRIEYKQTQLQSIIEKIVCQLQQDKENIKGMIWEIGKSFFYELKFKKGEKIVFQDEFFYSRFPLFYRQLKYIAADLNVSDFVNFLCKSHEKYAIIVNKSLLIPKAKNDSDDDQRRILFKYIISPKENEEQRNMFREQFPTIFNKIMIENENGWKQVFSRVYDLIESQFQSDSNLGNSSQISNKIQRFDQIKQIFQQVDEQIKALNQQFAFFGVILKEIGERYITHSSLLILWRFFCLSKSRRLRMLPPIPYLKRYFYDIFQATIKKDKHLQGQIQAQQQSIQILEAYENEYYKQQRKQVVKTLKSKTKTSFEIIQMLDEQLLIHYNRDDKPIEYLQDQKTYLNKWIQNYLTQIKFDIIQEKQSLFDKQIKGQFEIISMNIDKLLYEMPRLPNAYDYFKKNPAIDYRTYEKMLCDIILSSIQGTISQNISQLRDIYQQVFRNTQLQIIEIPFNKDQKGANYRVSQLITFLQVLRNECNQYSTQQKMWLLNFDKFGVDIQIESLLNEMKGCQEVCPICCRKCDLSNYLDVCHKHACKNGHQIRGINKVVIQGKPSLYTCEEIQDEDMIIVQNTNILIKWNEFKRNYSDWDFGDIYQLNLEKMLNVWNGQIGEQICQILKQPHQIKQQEQRKYYYENENAHYILVLEDSIWINDAIWDNLQLSTSWIVKKILKSEYSKLSVVLFNSEIKVAIDYDDVLYPFKQLVRNKLPKADIKLAFDSILNYLKDKRNKVFDKVIVIVHTKGLNEFPQEQISALCALPVNQNQQIIFRFYSLVEDDQELDKIVEILRKSQFDVEKYQFQHPDQVKEIWAERISRSKFFKF